MTHHCSVVVFITIPGIRDRNDSFPKQQLHSLFDSVHICSGLSSPRKNTFICPSATKKNDFPVFDCDKDNLLCCKEHNTDVKEGLHTQLMRTSEVCLEMEAGW